MGLRPARWLTTRDKVAGRVFRVLSAHDLDRQVTSDGATWLDRQLVNRDRGGLAVAGFGAEVRDALERRKDELR